MVVVVVVENDNFDAVVVVLSGTTVENASVGVVVIDEQINNRKDTIDVGTAIIFVDWVSFTFDITQLILIVL